MIIGYVILFAGDFSQISGTSDGFGTNARFESMNGIVVDAWGDVYVVENGIRHRIRRITPKGCCEMLIFV